MILGGRRSCGKTTELIKAANKDNLYILCASKARVRHIYSLATELKLDIPFPITVDDLPLKSCYIKEVLVDDVEDVLTQLIRKPVKYATTSMRMISV